MDTNSDDDNIYGDFVEPHEDPEITCIDETHKGLEKENKELTAEVKKLKQENEILRRNISSLFLTATAEIQRREYECTELQTKLDNLIFRRKGAPFGRPQPRDSSMMATQSQAETKKPVTSKMLKGKDVFQEVMKHGKVLDKGKDTVKIEGDAKAAGRSSISNSSSKQGGMKQEAEDSALTSASMVKGRNHVSSKDSSKSAHTSIKASDAEIRHTRDKHHSRRHERRLDKCIDGKKGRDDDKKGRHHRHRHEKEVDFKPREEQKNHADCGKKQHSQPTQFLSAPVATPTKDSICMSSASNEIDLSAVAKQSSDSVSPPVVVKVKKKRSLELSDSLNSQVDPAPSKSPATCVPHVKEQSSDINKPVSIVKSVRESMGCASRICNEVPSQISANIGASPKVVLTHEQRPSSDECLPMHTSNHQPSQHEATGMNERLSQSGNCTFGSNEDSSSFTSLSSSFDASGSVPSLGVRVRKRRKVQFSDSGSSHTVFFSSS